MTIEPLPQDAVAKAIRDLSQSVLLRMVSLNAQCSPEDAERHDTFVALAALKLVRAIDAHPGSAQPQDWARLRFAKER